MWKCRKCNTENPKQSSYCQTCGEKQDDIKGFTSSIKKDKSIKEMTVEQMYSKAGQRLPNGDYSLLTLYGKIAFGVGVGAIVVFILWIFLNIGHFDLTLFVVGLIAAVTTAVSCFIIANLIELVVSLKNEVNYNAQSNYVNARINKELLETLKDIQGQLNK